MQLISFWLIVCFSDNIFNIQNSDICFNKPLKLRPYSVSCFAKQTSHFIPVLSFLSFISPFYFFFFPPENLGMQDCLYHILSDWIKDLLQVERHSSLLMLILPLDGCVLHYSVSNTCWFWQSSVHFIYFFLKHLWLSLQFESGFVSDLHPFWRALFCMWKHPKSPVVFFVKWFFILSNL